MSSALRANVASGVARLQAQLDASPQLAALLLLVPLVLLIHLTLLTRDAIDAARAERTPLERRSARLEALAASGNWDTQIRAQQTAGEQLEQLAWRAASAELAAADLQTALRAIMARHMGWNRLKLNPEEPLRGLGGWRISAEVNGKLTDAGVLPLLQDLAEHQPRLKVERMQLSNLRGQTVTLQLSVVVLPENAP